MTQAIPKLITFDDFLEWKPEKGYHELHNGVIVEMPNPTGKHSAIAGFQSLELGFEIRRLQLPSLFPRNVQLNLAITLATILM